MLWKILPGFIFLALSSGTLQNSMSWTSEAFFIARSVMFNGWYCLNGVKQTEYKWIPMHKWWFNDTMDAKRCRFLWTDHHRQTPVFWSTSRPPSSNTCSTCVPSAPQRAPGLLALHCMWTSYGECLQKSGQGATIAAIFFTHGFIVAVFLMGYVRHVLLAWQRPGGGVPPV